MIVSGVKKDGERISVNNDFSVFIKPSMMYLENVNEKDIFVVINPEEELSDYKDGIFDMPDTTRANGTFKFNIIGTFTSKDGFDEINITEKLKDMSSKSKNITFNLSINGQSRGVDNEDDDAFRRMYKVSVDNENIKVGYYSMAMLGRLLYIPVIITHKTIYGGQILFSSDDEVENEKIVDSLLETIELIDAKDSVKLSDLEELTYSNSKYSCGTFSVNKANELSYVSKELLGDEFELIATSKSFKGNPFKYSDAPIGICIRKPGVQPGFSINWKNSRDEVKKELLDYYKKMLRQFYGVSNREAYVYSVGEESAILYAESNSCQPDEPYWTSYTFNIIQKDMQYLGMMYFNCNKPSKEKLMNLIKEFLSNIIIDGEKVDNYISEVKKEKLGIFGNEDGKIDGILASNMFFDDILFNNPEEIKYDGKKHYIVGLQMNAAVIDKYPVVKKNSAIFLEEIKNLTEFLEKNEALRIDVKDYHKNFNSITNKEPITGMLYLLFAAWHMIKIVEENKNSYKALIDENLIHGLPNGYLKLMNYIRTLRLYNNQNEDFEVSFIGVKHLDGPLGIIGNRVEFADDFKSTKTIRSKDIKFDIVESSEKKKNSKVEEQKIIKNASLNTLQYLNNQIPLIIDEIKLKVKQFKEIKEKIKKDKSILEVCDELVGLESKLLLTNLSYYAIGESGTITFSKTLEQLKIKSDNYTGSLNYEFNYDFQFNEGIVEFLDELIKLYESKTKDVIKNELIDLMNYYSDNNISVKLDKEKVLIISKIYDYDKEDLDFTEEDFYGKGKIVKDDKTKHNLKLSESKKSNILDILSLDIEQQQLLWEKEIKEIEKLKKKEIDKYTKRTNNELENELAVISENITNNIQELNKEIITKKELSDAAMKEKNGYKTANIILIFIEIVMVCALGDGIGIIWAVVLFIGVNCFIVLPKSWNLEMKINQYYSEIVEANRKKELLSKADGIEKKKQEVEDNILKYFKNINDNTLVPTSPKDVISYFKIIGQSKKNSYFSRSGYDLRNEQLKERICKVLSDDRILTITEIQSFDDELGVISNQKLSALLAQLVDDKILTRIVDNKKAYFALADYYKKQKIKINSAFETDFSRDIELVIDVLNKIKDEILLVELLKNQKIKELHPMRICQVIEKLDKLGKISIINKEDEIFIIK